MAAINYLFRPFGAFGISTSQRTGDTWNGGTAGIAPDRCLLWDQDLDEFYVGNGTPENIPTSGTAGAVLIGPEVFRGGNYGFGRAIISPTGLSGTQHNYNPTGLATATILRITPNGANMALTGIESQTGAIIDGRILVLQNISTSFDINLVNESTGSDADNRIAFTDTGTANVTIAIKPNGTFPLWYDNTSQRWRPWTNTRPTKHFHSGSVDGGKLERSIPWNIVSPTSSSEDFLLKTDVAITIQSVSAYIVGTTNVVYNIKFASTRTGAATSVFTSDITLTSTTGQSNNSGFNDNTIPAGSYVWVDVISISGTPTRFDGQIEFTQDYV